MDKEKLLTVVGDRLKKKFLDAEITIEQMSEVSETVIDLLTDSKDIVTEQLLINIREKFPWLGEIKNA